jgi:hypothetical protein
MREDQLLKDDTLEHWKLNAGETNEQHVNEGISREQPV